MTFTAEHALNETNPYEPTEVSESSAPHERPISDDRYLRWLGGILGCVSLVAGLVFVGWMLLFTSQVSIFALAVGGLIASPYLLIWLACCGLRCWFARILVAITLVSCCLFGAMAFDAVDEDAQGGLILLVAPIYQLVGTFVLLVLAVIIECVWRWRSALTTEANE